MPLNCEEKLNDGFLSPLGCNDTNRVELFVYENKNQTLITTRLDNLGKGPSGAGVRQKNMLVVYGESVVFGGRRLSKQNFVLRDWIGEPHGNF